MPIYEYKCPACGHQKDMIRKISDPDPVCPECNEQTMVKQVTAAAFRLKGTGWYETDFKNSGSGSGKDAEQAVKKKGKDEAISNEKKATQQVQTSTKQD